MKRFALILLLALFSVFGAQAQFTYKWTPVPMDSTWDDIKDMKATRIISKYSDMVESLNEILCYSSDEFTSRRPESGLSSFAADAVVAIAEKATGGKIDLGMINFGGIRTSIPKGDIRIYDIYSVFPFNNTIVVAEIKGSNLKKFLNGISTKGVVALSNVEYLVDGTEVRKMDVGGAPIDDEKIYKFATVNFLLTGGDGISIGKIAESVVDTGILVRDGIVALLREKGERGEILNLQPDGRVQLVNQPERRNR